MWPAIPSRDVRTAALRGLIERDQTIRQMERLRIPIDSSIKTSHFLVENVTLRDRIPAAASQIFGGDLDAAAPQLSIYYASTGKAPEQAAPPEAHAAYLEYLFEAGRIGDAETYAADNNLGKEAKARRRAPS